MTRVAIGQIVRWMRLRSGLEQAVDDVSRPPGSGSEAARTGYSEAVAPLPHSQVRGSLDTTGPQTAGPAQKRQLFRRGWSRLLCVAEVLVALGDWGVSCSIGLGCSWRIGSVTTPA